MADLLKQRRDTAANWTAADAVLRDGEIAVEKPGTVGEAPKLKIGDGTTSWSSLPYVINEIFETEHKLKLDAINATDGRLTSEAIAATVADATNYGVVTVELLRQAVARFGATSWYISPDQHYGAVGNDVANDTAPMQSTLDEHALTGKLIILRPGAIYRVKRLIAKNRVYGLAYGTEPQYSLVILGNGATIKKMGDTSIVGGNLFVLAHERWLLKKADVVQNTEVYSLGNAAATDPEGKAAVEAGILGKTTFVQDGVALWPTGKTTDPSAYLQIGQRMCLTNVVIDCNNTALYGLVVSAPKSDFTACTIKGCRHRGDRVWLSGTAVPVIGANVLFTQYTVDYELFWNLIPWAPSMRWEDSSGTSTANDYADGWAMYRGWTVPTSGQPLTDYNLKRYNSGQPDNKWIGCTSADAYGRAFFVEGLDATCTAGTPAGSRDIIQSVPRGLTAGGTATKWTPLTVTDWQWIGGFLYGKGGTSGQAAPICAHNTGGAQMRGAHCYGVPSAGSGRDANGNADTREECLALLCPSQMFFCDGVDFEHLVRFYEPTFGSNRLWKSGITTVQGARFRKNLLIDFGNISSSTYLFIVKSCPFKPNLGTGSTDGYVYADASGVSNGSAIVIVEDCSTTASDIIRRDLSWASAAGSTRVGLFPRGRNYTHINSRAVPYPRNHELSFHLAASPLTKTTVASVVKSGGNTGGGSLTLDATTPFLPGARVGVYTVRCTTAATNGGTFTVTNPAGTSLGTVAVGATFSNSIKFVIADGAPDFIVGDGFDVTVTAGTSSDQFIYQPLGGAVVRDASLSTIKLNAALANDTSIKVVVEKSSSGGADGSWTPIAAALVSKVGAAAQTTTWTTNTPALSATGGLLQPWADEDVFRARVEDFSGSISATAVFLQLTAL